MLWFTAKREALRQWCSPCSHTAGKADVEAGGKAAAPAAGYMLPRGGVRANMRIEPKVFFAGEDCASGTWLPFVTALRACVSATCAVQLC